MAKRPSEHGFSLPEDTDRLAELGRIAGALVHELKNPLGVILLNTELLQGQSLAAIPDAAARIRADKRLRRIIDSGRSLEAIVQAFLAFARPTRPDPVAVDINRLLRDLIEEQAELDQQAAVAVTLHADPLLAAVPGDVVHLRSVFLNILTNAREALAERATDRRILVVTRHSPEMVRVVIANNGPPLPERIAARLFEPFMTGKESGTGLGLAIVKRLVELHHGTIAISSDPSQGVSVTFEFPTPLGPAHSLAGLPAPKHVRSPGRPVTENVRSSGRPVVRTSPGTTSHLAEASLDAPPDKSPAKPHRRRTTRRPDDRTTGRPDHI